MRLLLAVLAMLLPAGASAHPHVWVTAKAELVYGQDGKVTAVRHHWTFDEGYSAFATQGLDANGDGKLSRDELQPFAQTSMESLPEFGFFTTVKVNGAKAAMGTPRDPYMTFEAPRLTLHFELPLKEPAANRLVVLEVYDPTFFVEFSPAEGADAVKLVNGPAGCALTVSRPKPAQAAATKDLSESFFQSLKADSTFGSQFGNRAMAACP